MKTLELELNKRLFIVESENFDESQLDEKYKITFFHNGNELKYICKGDELTEENLRSLIKNEISEFLACWNWDYVGNEPLDDDFFTPMQSFVSAVEASGYHWGENPVKFKDNEMDWEKRRKNRIDWETADSRTFCPEKCRIFEIL